MAQLKIKDAMDAVDAVKAQVNEIKASAGNGSGCNCGELIGRIESLELAIVALKKEIREGAAIFNKHLVDLHINQD